MENGFPTYDDLTVWARGSFCGGGDIDWKVEILRYAEAGTVRGLDFPKRETLRIEWEEWKPETAVRGSMATLRIISATDREWVDLYTVNAGMCVLDVYSRKVGEDWKPYWRGRLDTEFYEEPYVRDSDYEVTLTFSDFGCLNRIDYTRPAHAEGLSQVNEWGTENAGALLLRALRLCGLRDGDEPGPRTLVSSVNTMATGDALALVMGQHPGKTAQEVFGMAVPEAYLYRTANMFDEEGIPVKMRAAIEGLLLPLGLHLEQRCGKVWLYDLNALYEGGRREEIYWEGVDRTLGTAETYQDMTVSFSAYASARLMEESELPEEDCKPQAPVVKNAERDESKRPQYDSVQDLGLWDSFRVRTLADGKPLPAGLESIGERCSVCRHEAVLGSVDETVYVTGVSSPAGYLNIMYPGEEPTQHALALYKDYTPYAMVAGHYPQEMLRTKGVYLPLTGGKRMLRISVKMLLDPRYNPYCEGKYDESFFIDNSSRDWEKWRIWARQAYVPVSIEVCDEAGQIKAWWRNGAQMLADNTTGRVHMAGAPGGWVRTGEGTWDWKDCWLAYYPDRLEGTDSESPGGVSGWNVNRPVNGRLRLPCEISEKVRLMGEGMLIYMPPVEGYLRIRILKGVWLCQGDESELQLATWPQMVKGTRDVLRTARWWGYGIPEITVVEAPAYKEPEVPDAEYEGWLSRDSQESLSVETIFGTLPEEEETARGVLLHDPEAVTGAGVRGRGQVRGLTRAGYADTLERTLMGTLHSQYSRRRTTLSGEADLRIDDGDMAMVYTDAAMEDAVFVAGQETVDCATGYSEVTLVQLWPEEYEAGEFIKE